MSVNKSVPRLPHRLTTTELSSLFRRLDVNGDGELSIGEFRKIVEKLKLVQVQSNISNKVEGKESVGADSVRRILDDAVYDAFVSADTDKTSRGSLNMNEFKTAYYTLYKKMLDLQVNKVTEGENFVRATRYGSYIDGDSKKYVFETYLGSLSDINLKLSYDVRESVMGEGMSNFEKLVVKRTPLTGFTIEDINLLVVSDEHLNVTLQSNIMWWVDVCAKKWRESDAESFCEKVGISKDVVDSMSILEDAMPRLTYGHCDESTGYAAGKTTALSMIVQCLCLKNLPIVKRDPVWLSNLGAVGRYVSSKTAMFRPFMYNYRCHRAEILSAVAGREIEALWDEGMNCDDDDDGKTIYETSSRDYRDGSYAPHLNEFQYPRKSAVEDVEMYLLSSSDIKRRRPDVDRETYSLHIVNHGSHPIALYTYRVCNTDLPEQGFTFEQHTRAGVLGRITMGVWKKLLQVTMQHGVSIRCGELDDTPFALAQLIMSLIHSVSMDNTQSLDDWAKQLRESIEDIAVTKHSKHIELLNEFASEILEYVKGFNRDFAPIVRDIKVGAVNEPHASASVGGRQSAASELDLGDIKMPAPEAIHENAEVTGAGVQTRCKGLRSASIHNFMDVSISELTDRVDVLKVFAARGDTNSVHLLSNLLDGMSSLDKKGSLVWEANLEKIIETCEHLRDRYQMCLDEKRNFWSFVLGIVSIATFPFAVMTGYFGMNFHNMNDPGHILTSDYWPGFPGSDVIWVLSIIIYGAMLMWALHFEIFYSAS